MKATQRGRELQMSFLTRSVWRLGGLLAVVGLLAVSSCSSGTDGTSILRFATFTEGTGWYAYGASIGELLRPRLPAGLGLDVLPLAGGVANPRLLSQGKADLAINFDVNTRWAIRGEVIYQEPMENLRALVGGFAPYYLTVVVRDDFPLERLEDLIQARMPVRLYTVTVGAQGERAVRMLLEAYGVDYQDIEDWGGAVHLTSFDVIKTAFQDGRADLLIHGIPEGHPSVTEIAVLTPVRFLPLDRKAVEWLTQTYGLEEAVLPAGSFRGQDEEVATVGWSVTVDATTRMSDELAYLITHTIIENRDVLAAAHTSLAGFDPALAPTKVGIPLHPGAERYYREAGLLD